MRWALDRRGISPQAKLTLVSLAERANDRARRWEAWPRQADVARELEVSVAAVKRHLGELLTAGLIRREERKRVDGRPDSIRYVLLADRTALAAASDSSPVSGPDSSPVSYADSSLVNGPIAHQRTVPSLTGERSDSSLVSYPPFKQPEREAQREAEEETDAPRVLDGSSSSNLEEATVGVPEPFRELDAQLRGLPGYAPTPELWATLERKYGAAGFDWAEQGVKIQSVAQRYGWGVTDTARLLSWFEREQRGLAPRGRSNGSAQRNTPGHAGGQRLEKDPGAFANIDRG